MQEFFVQIDKRIITASLTCFLTLFILPSKKHHKTPGYVYSREMHIRLQDYIVRFRVERAANLLTYSDESLGRIAEYVNFPSQSYFGKVFKQYMHETPKEYRESHKTKEFIEKK